MYYLLVLVKSNKCINTNLKFIQYIHFLEYLKFTSFQLLTRKIIDIKRPIFIISNHYIRYYIKRNRVMRKYNLHLSLIYVAILLVTSFFSACSSTAKAPGTQIHYTTMELEEVSDSGEEYDIIITDPGYDSFLLTQKPMEFYSQSYYENWNRYYVTDWNAKVQTQAYRNQRYNDVFETYINYEPSINYGLTVNYKLYNYFLFVQKRYGVKFNVPRAINY